MYLQHFGLERPPFKITPDTSLFFAGSKRGAALDALAYAITSGEGIIKVVGEVGSGKTMLCRMLEVRLSESVELVYIANPSLSPDNILHVIAHELGLDVDSRTSKLDVMQKLQQYLLQKHAEGRPVVVFVEEAQSMPVETLEEIRLLSNLETDESKLLQMVLFGQPELDEKLAQPHIRQLKERITHSFYLEPFPPEDTLKYLNFRLRAVGYKGPDLFNRKTAVAIKKASGGLTRRINILADKALMAAFSEGRHEVTAKHVHTAAVDSDFEKAHNRKPLLYATAAVLCLGLAVWMGTLLPGLDNSMLVQTNHTGREAAEVTAQQAVDGTAGSSETEADSDSPHQLLAARLRDTREWLMQVPDRHYSIQLFMARKLDAAAVEQFLRDVSETLDFEKIYIYETRINGRPMYSVLYDEYDSRQQARITLKSLPADLQASKPYLRRVSALRKDLVMKSDSMVSVL